MKACTAASARVVLASQQQQKGAATGAGAKQARALPKGVPLAGVLAGAHSALAGLAQAELSSEQRSSLESLQRNLIDAPAASKAAAAVAPPSFDLPSLELPADVSSLLGDNPLLVAGAAVLLVGVPLAIGSLTGGGSSAVKPRSIPAGRALEALAADGASVLVDIRPKGAIKEQGSPDLRSAKKSAVQLPLFSVSREGEATQDEGFGAKLARARGVSEEATLILLDSDGTTYGAAAKAIAEALPGLRQLYSVAGGAQGWQASGAPWREPGKMGLSLPSVDLRAFSAGLDNLAEDIKEAPTMTKGLLGVGAIAGASLVLFNSLEGLLEVAGVLAAGQFAFKLLYADNREQTINEIKKIVEDKVAIQDAGQDLKKIASTLIEEAVELQEDKPGGTGTVKKTVQTSSTGRLKTTVQKIPGSTGTMRMTVQPAGNGNGTSSPAAAKPAAPAPAAAAAPKPEAVTKPATAAAKPEEAASAPATEPGATLANKPAAGTPELSKVKDVSE